ncbi:MAG: hydroxyethylthiazole kinase [Oscillospiraceae bacterium]|jgi:hydroxyethylthiazole kinase
MLKEMLEQVRETVPLIHNITNYVTVNDCANILLACGGSPIMADEPEEVEDIQSICGGLTLNIGTLNTRTVPSMLLAGRRANKLGHPVILDPVGAGASHLRTETARKLVQQIRFAAIRGNISEIKALVGLDSDTQGVDASVADAVTEETLDNILAFVGRLSAQTGAVIAITGSIDLVADSNRAFVIHNGRREMGKITGTGCMLTAMTAAYLTANPNDPLTATAAAVCAMGVCGEIAFARLQPGEGNATYRSRILDAVCHLDGETLEEQARYELRTIKNQK